jgi:hypothetical protein
VARDSNGGQMQVEAGGAGGGDMMRGQGLG